MLAPGSQIGRYILGRRLARGGMAELYVAKAVGIGGFEKPCVLKLVLPHLGDDRAFVEMFLDEARLAATLDHPHVVHVTDIGEIDGEYFFVMEYLDGRDVRAMLRATTPGPLPLAAALTIAHGVAEGLHYVHERRDATGKFLGLVHRDVSPSNVMVTFDGVVKLVDFGIAKATEMHHATRTGVLKGKVHYMSPEQCEGLALDRRTDVFSLGVLLYEMTTGRTLFSGTNEYYVMTRIVRGVFATPREIDPTYPIELERIVLRALARDPEDRYVSTEALQVDLEQFAASSGIVLSARGLAENMTELFGEPGPLNFTDDGEETAPTLLLANASNDRMAGVAGQIGSTDVLSMPASRVRAKASRGKRFGQGLAIGFALGVPLLGLGGYAAWKLADNDVARHVASRGEGTLSSATVANPGSGGSATTVRPPVEPARPTARPAALPAFAPPPPVQPAAIEPIVLAPPETPAVAATREPEIVVAETDDDDRSSSRPRSNKRKRKRPGTSSRPKSTSGTSSSGSKSSDVDALFPPSHR